LRDIPAGYLDDGESVAHIFLHFRATLEEFVRQSLVANFQYPCSDLRDSVRSRMRQVRYLNLKVGPYEGLGFPTAFPPRW